MHLTLSPRWPHAYESQTETTLHVAGDSITIDGTPYDLSSVPEGGEGEWPDSPITGKIKRIDGMIHATVSVVLGPDAADEQPADPTYWVIPNASGAVTIPALRNTVEEGAA